MSDPLCDPMAQQHGGALPIELLEPVVHVCPCEAELILNVEEPRSRGEGQGEACRKGDRADAAADASETLEAEDGVWSSH